MVIKWALVPLTVLLLIKTTTSYANEIYMNQVGDNLTMTVVQDGKDNYFQYCSNGTNDSNCTDMNGNAHNRADGFASDDSTVTSSTVGDDNTVVVAHATGQNNTNENITNIDIVGDRNKAQSIFSNHSNGSHPHSNMDWGGLKETNIEIDGDDNTVKHSSDSYGEVEANISVTGDDNDVIVYQRSMRNVANIDVTNAGGAVSVNVQQLGSSYQDTGLNSYSLTQYCTNSNGCTVNMTQY
jgi:Arc/MetJ family transcription regulator